MLDAHIKERKIKNLEFFVLKKNFFMVTGFPLFQLGGKTIKKNNFVYFTISQIKLGRKSLLI